MIFPALREFWDEVRTLAPTDAAQYLETRAREEEVTVEVMGVGVGTATLGWAGPLILLLFAVVMSGHSRHLERLAEGGSEDIALYPWMALFSDPLSVLATAVSIFFLPLAAASSIVARTAPGSPLAATWAGAVAVALLALNGGVMRRLWGVRGLVFVDAVAPEGR